MERLVGGVDLVVDCAPLFTERFLMNREVVRQNKVLVECAMYDMDAQITTIIPGKTPCLSCLFPEDPRAWRRQFPVFGAVSGTIACLGAVEAIKVLSGIGTPLAGQLLMLDMREMNIRKVNIERRVDCKICGVAN